MNSFLGNDEVLIVRLGKIGDIVIASSIFSAIKKKYPDVRLSLLTLKTNKEVLKYNRDIDKVYFTKKNLLIYPTLLSLSKKKFDLLIDLNDDPSKTSRIIRKTLNAKTTAGFDFGENEKPDIYLKRPDKEKTHIIERLGKLLGTLDPEFRNIKPEPILYLGKNENDEIKNQLNSYKNNNKIISINLSAGALIRYWEEEKWTQLIGQIHELSDDWKFILLNTQKDIHIAEKIRNALPENIFIPVLYNSFQHYASYIYNTDLLITADTAAVHIASAFNIPVIALYPDYEWNFISWQPLSAKYRSLRASAHNINSINVEEVFKSFQEIVLEIY